MELRSGSRALSGIVGAGLALAATATAADAKTYVVTNGGDGGRGTLRAAVEKADQHRGRDRIELSARRLPGSIRLRSDLEIEGPATILGPGVSRLTVRGPRREGALIRFAPFRKGPELAIRGLRLERVGIRAKTQEEASEEVELSVVRSELSGRGIEQPGVYLDGYYGGHAKVSETTVTGFTTGVRVDDGGARIEASRISGNGTGVTGFEAGLTIKNSTISGNSYGGGVRVSYYAGALISKSTISGNTRVDPEGERVAYGGGLTSPYESEARVVNSTISGNVAEGAGSRGGGIYGNVEVQASTVTANGAEQGGGFFAYLAFEPGPIPIENSIVAGNDATTGPDCAGPTTSRGHNLFGPGGCGTADPTDLVGVDPLLGPLADNGGPTRTHALLDGSPAIDAGADVGLATDQRGVPRGVPPDIGSYEKRTGA